MQIWLCDEDECNDVEILEERKCSVLNCNKIATRYFKKEDTSQLVSFCENCLEEVLCRKRKME